MGERLTGRVKWFNDQKGYGFITPDDGREDIFVHQSSIVSHGFRSLGEGEEVQFNIESSSEGRTKAINVTDLNGNPVQGSRSSAAGTGGRGAGRSGGRGGRGGGGCYSCGEMGHMARDCPSGGSGGRHGGGGGGSSGCFNCGESGHFARECPNTSGR